MRSNRSSRTARTNEWGVTEIYYAGGDKPSTSGVTTSILSGWQNNNSLDNRSVSRGYTQNITVSFISPDRTGTITFIVQGQRSNSVDLQSRGYNQSLLQPNQANEVQFSGGSATAVVVGWGSYSVNVQSKGYIQTQRQPDLAFVSQTRTGTANALVTGWQSNSVDKQAKGANQSIYQPDTPLGLGATVPANITRQAMVVGSFPVFYNEVSVSQFNVGGAHLDES